VAPRLAMIDESRSETPGPSAPATAAPPSPDPTPNATAKPVAHGSGHVNENTGTGSAPGTWQFANGSGPVWGTAGPVYSFRVAVESGLPVSVSEFTGVVDGALGDWRSWAGAGTLRMVRVPGSSASNFTVYLAKPWTAYSLCLGVNVDILIGGVPYTSCQAGAAIVINADRYLGGARAFTGSLTIYRQYAINHEVGHRLGRAHVSCPGAGQLAPVMQQQTLGMQGCAPNPWPYPNAAPPPTTPPPTTPPPTTPPPTTPPPTATPTGSSSTEPSTP